MKQVLPTGMVNSGTGLTVLYELARPGVQIIDGPAILASPACDVRN